VTADLGGGADDGSSEDGPTGARDSVGADVERLVGGFGDDVLRGDSKTNMLTGGAGDDLLAGNAGRDVLTGATGDDRLQGGDGDDTLKGVTGDDVLAGGEGDDELDGGPDSDAIGGGPGKDLATYASRATAVVVTVGAGGANDGGVEDGTAAARDSVGASVEDLAGGAGGDSLTGNELDNALTGGAGSDSLFGLAGADSLNAADGLADAVIDCGASADPTAVFDLGLDPAPISCG
jgi:Ca2+-binding RTX toxin-like protein